MKSFSIAALAIFLASTANGLSTTARIRDRIFGRKMPTYEYANTRKDINNVLKQNKEWVKEKVAENPEFYKELGTTHKPSYMWIGCSDARVPENDIMGVDAGSVFVVRNVANTVCSTDFNLQSALQYAVRFLKVPHIIVCGHYDCGGVRASTANQDHVPPLENWLRNIRDIYRIHRKELDAISDPEKRHRRLVELNVVEQCINLYKTSAVQQERYETGKDRAAPFATPRIHACVFDPKDGILRPVEIDFQSYQTQLQGIYDMYDTTGKKA